MAYRTFYHSEKENFKKLKSSIRFSAILILCFILFCYLVGGFWADGTEYLRRTIQYLNSCTFVATLNDFAEKLRYVEEHLDVFAEFCGKIIP